MFLRARSPECVQNFCRLWEDKILNQLYILGNWSYPQKELLLASVSGKKKLLSRACHSDLEYVPASPLVHTPLPFSERFPCFLSTTQQQVFNSPFGKDDKPSLHYTLYTNHVYFQIVVYYIQMCYYISHKSDKGFCAGV